MRIFAFLAIIATLCFSGTSSAQAMPGFQPDVIGTARMFPFPLPAGPIVYPHSVTIPANQVSSTLFFAQGTPNSSLTTFVSLGPVVPDFSGTPCGLLNINLTFPGTISIYSYNQFGPVNPTAPVFLNLPPLSAGVELGFQAVVIDATLSGGCQFTAATNVMVM
jgi:hypothetical protein